MLATRTYLRVMTEEQVSAVPTTEGRVLGSIIPYSETAR